ncbi:MAG: hypothetical protein AAF378_07370 [Cyanobacteria bacterium P01_A01_bin.84]
MVRLLSKKKQKVNILTAFTISTFCLHAIALFFLVIQGLTIRQLSIQKSPTFAQLVDGELVNTPNSLKRQPQEIRQFVSRTMISMFNWSGKLAPQTFEQVSNPQSDPGIFIKTPKGGSKKVTTNSWLASFALSEEFRRGFLSKIAELTPPEIFAQNHKQSISVKLVISRIYPPQQITTGKWRVGMVARIVQNKRDTRPIVTPFNKDVLVQSTDNYQHPIPTDISDLQKAIYQVREARLEIYEIRDLCLTDKYENNNIDGQVDSCTKIRNSQPRNFLE